VRPDVPSADSAAGETVAIGRIVGTHALRGEVRIHLYNPDSAALDYVDSVRLHHTDGRRERRGIANVRRHKRVLLARLDGCASIEDAEPLIGTEIHVARNELPELGPDELYHFQLVGMSVHTVDGRDLGRVVEVMDLTAHAVCVVRDGQHEYLIPFVDEIVRESDPETGRMVIDPLPGLLDD